MGGQFGTQALSTLAGDVGAVITVGYKVIKGNVFALFELAGVLASLKSVDFGLAKKELGELDQQDRTAVETSFKASVSGIPDTAVVSKLQTGADCVEAGFGLVEDALGFVDRGKALVTKIKSLLGL